MKQGENDDGVNFGESVVLRLGFLGFSCLVALGGLLKSGLQSPSLSYPHMALIGFKEV